MPMDSNIYISQSGGGVAAYTLDETTYAGT